MSENLKARMLQRDELFRLKKFYRMNDSKMNPEDLYSASVIETSDEKIVGMLGLELIPHAGPLYVLPEFRGHGLAVQLYRTIEANLTKKPRTGYYTFPSNDISKHIAQKLGLEKLPCEVWKREF